MGLLNCVYPEHPEPFDLARDFQRKMAPLVVDIDQTDVRSTSIAQLESALDSVGERKAEFTPLLSMKRNAQLYAPQYRLAVRLGQTTVMEGAVNRRCLGFTWDDPIPASLLAKVLRFANGIPGVEIEAEDDEGNPIDIQSVARAALDCTGLSKSRRQHQTFPGRARLRMPRLNAAAPMTPVVIPPKTLPVSSPPTPPAKKKTPRRMNTMAAHSGVGGVYRVLHRLQTRSLSKATTFCGGTRVNSALPHPGQSLLTG